MVVSDFQAQPQHITCLPVILNLLVPGALVREEESLQTMGRSHEGREGELTSPRGQGWGTPCLRLATGHVSNSMRELFSLHFTGKVRVI